MLMRREAHKKDVALSLIERIVDYVKDIAEPDGIVTTTRNWQSIIIKQIS
jgi:hypothetical protein